MWQRNLQTYKKKTRDKREKNITRSKTRNKLHTYDNKKFELYQANFPIKKPSISVANSVHKKEVVVW